MKFTTKRLSEKQLFTICLVCGGALLLVMGTLLYLGYADNQKIRNENASLKKERDRLEKAYRQIPQLQEEKERLQADVQKNVERLPSVNDVKIDEFLRFLDGAALETGYEEFAGASLVQMAAVEEKDDKAAPRGKTPEPAAAAQEHFKKHAYSAKYRGTFYQLGKLINIIESNDRFMNICAFKIEQPKNLKDPLKDFSLKIGTYTYTPNSPAAGTGANP